MPLRDMSPLSPSPLPWEGAARAKWNLACTERERWPFKGKNKYVANSLYIGGKAGTAEIISVIGTELATMCRRELQLSHNLTQDL